MREYQRRVMFGAGNVGRGFLGQLFSESGYRVVFVDIDEPLIARHARPGAYTIRLVDNQHTEEVRVGPVTGILSRGCERRRRVSGGGHFGGHSGRRASPAGHRPHGRRRASPCAPGAGWTSPLNLIVCENLKGAASLFRGMVAEHLDAAWSASTWPAMSVSWIRSSGAWCPSCPPSCARRTPR